MPLLNAGRSRLGSVSIWLATTGCFSSTTVPSARDDLIHDLRIVHRAAVGDGGDIARDGNGGQLRDGLADARA